MRGGLAWNIATTGARYIRNFTSWQCSGESCQSESPCVLLQLHCPDLSDLLFSTRIEALNTSEGHTQFREHQWLCSPIAQGSLSSPSNLHISSTSSSVTMSSPFTASTHLSPISFTSAGRAENADEHYPPPAQVATAREPVKDPKTQALMDLRSAFSRCSTSSRCQ